MIYRHLFQKKFFLLCFCEVIIMSQTKREQVVSHLRYLRQELREIHLGIQDDGLFPEPGELRGIMAQMEALLALVEGNPKVNSSYPKVTPTLFKDEPKVVPH